MNSYFLYADDDDDDGRILKELWQEHNQCNDIVWVTDGYDLLKFLQSINEQGSFPSLIILDLDLPRLRGTEILKLLKTDDIYRLIPVIILTAAASAQDISLCKKLGAEVMIKASGAAHWKKLFTHLGSYIDES